MELLFLLTILPGAFFAPVIHDFTKARVSAMLGDPTPKKYGFLTSNPFKFIEPIGFLFLFIFHYGWGKHVPTSPLYYKNRRNGIILTHVIPMFVNLSVGLLVLGVWRIIFNTIDFENMAVPYIVWEFTDQSVRYFGWINIGNAVFNLLPVHPLAGSKLITLFVSQNVNVKMHHYEKHLQLVLLFLLFFGFIGQIFGPMQTFLASLVWS